MKLHSERNSMAFTVFLSHNSSDEEHIDKIEKGLQEIGVKPYIFKKDPRPGRMLSDKIESSIRDSDVLLVLFTTEGQYSQWMNSEIGYAKAAEIPIIPLVDDNIEQTDLPFLGGIEYIPINLENPEPALSSLIEDIRRRRWKKRLLYGGLICIFAYFIGRAYLDHKKTQNQKVGSYDD